VKLLPFYGKRIFNHLIWAGPDRGWLSVMRKTDPIWNMNNTFIVILLIALK
jgi:hypothetical protein